MLRPSAIDQTSVNRSARPGPPPPDEQKAIEGLARELLSVGQIVPVIVTPGNAGRYVLIDGGRRLHAAEWLESQGREFLLSALVWLNPDALPDADIARRAIHANLKRRGLTPLQLAHLIANLRKEHNWTGTAEVASYLGVSRAQISEHDKLLKRPEGMDRETYDHLLDLVQAGRAGAGTAFYTLTHVEPAKASEVLKKAEEIAVAESEAAGSAKSTSKTRKRATGKPDKSETSPRSANERESVSPEAATEPKIEKKHIQKAARESGAVKSSTQRTVPELRMLFAKLSAPEWPDRLRNFASTVADAWWNGRATDKEVLVKWRELADNLRGASGPAKSYKPKPHAKKRAARAA